MADAFSTDKLQPYLLDRLIDEHPESRQESRTVRVMTPAEFRAAVLRDLRWLLNASAHVRSEFADFGEVSRSVLNYGTADFSGQTVSDAGIKELEHNLAAAIRIFEPRILPGTLSVKAKRDTEAGSPNTLVFEIRGDLWATPFPEELYIKTEVDLETGICKI